MNLCHHRTHNIANRRTQFTRCHGTRSIVIDASHSVVHLLASGFDVAYIIRTIRAQSLYTLALYVEVSWHKI